MVTILRYLLFLVYILRFLVKNYSLFFCFSANFIILFSFNYSTFYLIRLNLIRKSLNLKPHILHFSFKNYFNFYFLKNFLIYLILLNYLKLYYFHNWIFIFYATFCFKFRFFGFIYCLIYI